MVLQGCGITVHYRLVFLKHCAWPLLLFTHSTKCSQHDRSSSYACQCVFSHFFNFASSLLVQRQQQFLLGWYKEKKKSKIEQLPFHLSLWAIILYLPWPAIIVYFLWTFGGQAVNTTMTFDHLTNYLWQAATLAMGTLIWCHISVHLAIRVQNWTPLSNFGSWEKIFVPDWLINVSQASPASC